MATMQQLYEELIVCSDQLDAAMTLYDKGVLLHNACVEHADKAMLPVSVEYYLEEVNRSGLVSCESLIQVNSPVIDTINNILQGILSAIKWIVTQFVDLFRLIFDMYYRAQRKFIKQQQFLLQFTNPDMRAKFENTSMKTITHVDFIKFNNQLNKLILVLQSATRVAAYEHVDKLFTNCEAEVGCRIDGGNTLVNLTDVTKLEIQGMLKDIGWSYTGVVDANTAMLLTVHDTTTLQRLNKAVNAEAKLLQSQVEKSVRENTHPATVTNLQERLNMQRQIHAFVKSGLVIIATRMSWMDHYFSQFVDLMRTIQKG